MLGWFSDIRKDPWRLGRHGFALLAMLMAGAFLWIVQWRIVTYVCGNDPMLYIRAARTLLRPDYYGANAVRHALTFVAPGYPVFLAAAIKLFGSLSPYWINAVVLTATLPLMWFTFRRLMGSGRAAAFSLLAWLWIVFSGHPLHAPFMLYPFRETPRFFLVILSCVLVLAGTGSGKPRGLPLLLSGLTLLVACAIREPSVLVLPGLLLGLAGRLPSWPARFKAWAWWLAPWALAGAGALLALCCFKPAGFSQFSVVRYLSDHAVALARIRLMLDWFPQRAGGWLGLGLILTGVARAALKSKVLLAWFLLPALLFFVFCAYMQMHDRYFLTSLLFLVVFAGYGLDGVCTAADRAFRSWAIFHGFRQPASDVFAGGLLALLVIGLARTPGHLSVWGPTVRAAEVREWQTLAAGLEPTADGRVRIATEQRTRYLEDMLLSYTDVELLDPKRMEQWPPDCTPAHYFRPLNHKALWSTPQWLADPKVFAHRLIEYRMDLLPMAADDEVIHKIGAGTYAHYRLSPWRADRCEQTVEVVPNLDQIAWIDWAGSDPALEKDIRIVDAETGQPFAHCSSAGNGLQAVFLPAEKVRGNSARLAVKAAGPLPARPVVAVVDAAQTFEFPLGKDRRLSANHFFESEKPDEARIDLPAVRTGRPLPIRMPRLLAEVPAAWEVVLDGTFGNPDGGVLCGTFERGGEVFHDPSRNSGPVRLAAFPGDVVEFRFVSETPGGKPMRLDVETIGFRARRQAPDGEKIGQLEPQDVNP